MTSSYGMSIVSGVSVFATHVPEVRMVALRRLDIHRDTCLSSLCCDGCKYQK